LIDGSVPEKRETTIGVLLRAARESRGESLEDAARVTRIGKNYLAALEENCFEKLPNPAYVKGFLRVYGKHLGLSPDDLIHRYEEFSGSVPAMEQSVPEGDSPSVKPVRLPMKSRWMIPLFLLAMVIITATFIPQREPQPPRPALKTVPSRMSAPVPVQQPMSSVAADPLSSPQAAPEEAPEQLSPETPVPSSMPGGVVLKLKVIQDCWLSITIDGALSQQYDLKAGDLIEWKGERSFSLDIGNAGGIEAEFNGKALPSFGESGETAHVVLPAEQPGEQ